MKNPVTGPERKRDYKCQGREGFRYTKGRYRRLLGGGKVFQSAHQQK